jgi:DNA-binding NarL/FixJ family response regulator
MTGLDVLRRMEPVCKFQTILIADEIQPEDQVNGMLLGAAGILRKSASCEALFKSIQSVVRGEIWVGRDVIKHMVSLLRRSRHDATPSPSRVSLTTRELEIIKAVAAGLGNKEISEALGISPLTVKNHLSKIFSKLVIRNRLELLLYANRSGLKQ